MLGGVLARRRDRAVRRRSRDLGRGHQHPRPQASPASCRRRSSTKKFKDKGGSITQSPRVPTVGRFTFPFLAGGKLGGWKTPDILGWFERKHWFFVSDISGILRGLVSTMSWMTVFAVAMVPFSAWLLWRTRFGLRLRICGERPGAGEAQGINIYFYKYIGVITSGFLAGLGGAFIASQELSGVYKEGQTNGSGIHRLGRVDLRQLATVGDLRRSDVVRLSLRPAIAGPRTARRRIHCCSSPRSRCLP